MIGFIRDDGGRKAAGYKGKAGDCVVRALAIVLDRREDYRELYREMADGMAEYGRPRSARNGVSRKVSRPIFEQHGLRKVSLPKGPRPTYSEAYARYGNCLVGTRKHVCAIVDGNLHDMHDGRTYQWGDGMFDPPETRERKAQSIWVAT